MPKHKALTFKQAINKYYAKLHRAASFMSGDPWMADDIVQDTFLAARNAWESFRGEASYYTWLYRIMLNTFRKKLRDEKKHLSLTDLESGRDGQHSMPVLESSTPLPQEFVEKHEEAELIRAAIDSMPVHHREVLVLRFLEEKSYEEIAEILDCSLGTVKSRLHYALKHIGEMLRTPEARKTLEDRAGSGKSEVEK